MKNIIWECVRSTNSQITPDLLDQKLQAGVQQSAFSDHCLSCWYSKSLSNSASGLLCTLCFPSAPDYDSVAQAEPTLGCGGVIGITGPDQALSIQPSLFRGNFRLTITPSLPSTSTEAAQTQPYILNP